MATSHHIISVVFTQNEKYEMQFSFSCDMPVKTDCIFLNWLLTFPARIHTVVDWVNNCLQITANNEHCVCTKERATMMSDWSVGFPFSLLRSNTEDVLSVPSNSCKLWTLNSHQYIEMFRVLVVSWKLSNKQCKMCPNAWRQEGEDEEAGED